MNTFDVINEELEKYSKQFNIKVSEGYYKSVRLSTMFESFEFNFHINKEGEAEVVNLWHDPKLVGGSLHKEFSSNLEKPFTILDCFIYDNKHSKSKFSGIPYRYSNDMKDKVQNRIIVSRKKKFYREDRSSIRKIK